MIKKPARNPRKKYPQAFTARAKDMLKAGVRSAARAAILTLLPLIRAARAKFGGRKHKRARYAVFALGAAAAAAALLFVFLAPGAAAPASDTADSQAPASDAPIQTAAPNLIAAAPVITTEPEPVVTPDQTKKPSPKPKPSPSPAPTKSAAKPETAASDLDKLAAFYRVEADSYYDDVGYSSNHYDYTDEELKMLAQIIQAEAGGEPYEGKIAVGNVVMNRTLCGHWGSRIADQTKGLVYKPDLVPRQSCIDAARAVLDDELWVVPQNTYNFKTSGGTWRSFTFWGQIGRHYFYTYHYGNRYCGDSVPPALFKRVYKWPQYGCKPAERVSRIQYMLKSLGYKVSQDGYFGKTTREQLIEFQKDKGLAADGVAGESTIKALIRAFGVEKYRKKFK